MHERLSPHDRYLLLELIDCCHTDESSPDFFTTIHPRLRALLPHRIFAYGRVHARDSRMLQVVNAGFPKDYLDLMLPADTSHHCPMLGRWVKAQRPIYYDQHVKRRRVTVNQPSAAVFADSNLASLFADIGLRNIAVHGVMDAAQSTAACYAFARLEDQWSARSATLLRIITPHLYTALGLQGTSPATTPVEPRRTPLTKREQLVLHWMSHGKSSIDIGTILDISVSTVHVHTQNIVRKLGADNRVHAVALALRTGVIGL